MSEVVRAAGLIVYRKCQELKDPIQFLLLKASYGTFHWSPPKGHVDPGEDDLQTAIRETEEECGFKADHLKIDETNTIELNYVVSIKSTTSGALTKKDKISKYFPAMLLDSNRKVILSEEHTEFAWLGIEEACKTAHFNDIQEALRKVYAQASK